jgi:uncharacterized protein (DUF736 family)
LLGQVATFARALEGGNQMASSTIIVGSTNWDSKARKLIDKKSKFNLVVKGVEAGAAWDAIKNATSRGWATRKKGGPTPREPVSVSLTIVICLTVIVAAGLAVVAAVCLYGMHKGYDIKVKHNVTGPMIWDHKLTIILIPPASKSRART